MTAATLIALQEVVSSILISSTTCNLFCISNLTRLQMLLPSPVRTLRGGRLLAHWYFCADESYNTAWRDTKDAHRVPMLLPEQRQRLQFVCQAAQVQPAIPAFKTVGLL